MENYFLKYTSEGGMTSNPMPLEIKILKKYINSEEIYEMSYTDKWRPIVKAFELNTDDKEKLDLLISKIKIAIEPNDLAICLDAPDEKLEIVFGYTYSIKLSWNGSVPVEWKGVSRLANFILKLKENDKLLVANNES